jgi:hypothetical protein
VNLRLIVLVIVLSCCALGRAEVPTKLTVANYNRVAIGSSVQFVYKCLGRETSISFHDGLEKTLKWEANNATVIIQFKNNRVVEKWQSGL